MHSLKISLASFLCFLSFVLITPISAVEIQKPPTVSPSVNNTINKAVVLATVNIIGANIVSQKDNTINISFILSNRTGIQTGVNYGIELYDTDSKTPYLVDEKIYEESLTLLENSILNKEVSYTYPKILSGDFNLFITVKNGNSFPFAKVSLGKVTLKASDIGLLISPQTCFTQVLEEKDIPHYNILQKVSINKEQTLKLTCEATNQTDKDLSVSPIFETFNGSSYGSVVSQNNVEKEILIFKSKEKKTFSINLPVGSIPQIYNMNVNLLEGNVKSNTINISYVLNGARASIMNLTLNKDNYQKGDNAILSLLYNSSSNQKTENTPLNLSVKAIMLNDKGQECIDPINIPLIRNIKNPIRELSAVVKTTCSNPNTNITLLDDKGNILDQKDFGTKLLPVSPVSNEEKKSNTNKGLIILAIGILVVAGVAVYLRNIKKNDNEKSI
jgi:hypothetical protein